MPGVLFGVARRLLLLIGPCLVAVSAYAAPTAVDDFYSEINDGEPIVLEPLANDFTDSPLDPVLNGANLLSNNGGEILSVTGSEIIFLPDPGFSGTVQIQYEVVDNYDSMTTTGLITLQLTLGTVDAVEDYFSFSYNDGSVTAPAPVPVLNNDLLPAGIPAVSLVSNLSPADAGTLMLSSSGDGFTFLPAAGFVGMATFTYEVSVDGISDTAVVTLTVSPPMETLQAVDDVVSVPVNDGSLSEPIFIDVLGNDSLYSDFSYSLSLVGGLSPAEAGTIIPAIEGFEFLPAPGFTGQATFTYQILQGSESSTATVTITVGAGGDLTSNTLLNPEERQMAMALDNACSNANGALAESCQTIATLSPEQQREAIRQILPNQARAQALGAFLQQNQQLTNLRTRLEALRSGARGLSFAGLSAQLYDNSLALGNMLESLGGGSAGEDSPFADTPWGLFVTGRINLGDYDDGPRDGFDFETLGITAGIDYRLDDRLVLGAAIGYGTSDNDYDHDGGGLDIDSWSLSFYGNYYPLDNLYVDWVLGYGWNDYSGHRRLRFGPIDAVADYDADGEQYSGSATVGYQWNRQAWQLGTYLRLDYIHTQIDGYREKGGAGLALVLKEQNARSLESALGGRLARAFSFSRGVLIPGVELEWIHQWQGDDRRITAMLAQAPEAGEFSIRTEALDENYLKAGVSLTGVFTGGKSGFVRYQTSVGRDHVDEHTIEAGFRMEF